MSKQLDVFGSFVFEDYVEEQCIGSVELEEDSKGQVKFPDSLEFDGVNYIREDISLGN